MVTNEVIRGLNEVLIVPKVQVIWVFKRVLIVLEVQKVIFKVVWVFKRVPIVPVV